MSELRKNAELHTVSANKVNAAEVRWLFPGRVPLGKITLLDGDPGLGKSTLLLDLAARLSTGRAMPTAESPPPPAEEDDPEEMSLEDIIKGMRAGKGTEWKCNGAGGRRQERAVEPTVELEAALSREEPLRGDVTLLTAEDGLQDTVLPRLQAAGADLERVHLVKEVRDGGEAAGRPPAIPRDLDLLEETVRRTGSRLLIVDPLAAFLGRGADVYREQSIRRCLHRLGELAERTGCAAVLLRHLNKGTSPWAFYRGGGSIGLIAAARSGLLVARDPDRPGEPLHGVLASTKSNLGPRPASLCYRLEPAGQPGVCRVVWGGTSCLTADDLVRRPVGEERGPLGDAMAFLRELLRDGPQSATDCRRGARQNGISERTLRRAKVRMKVVSVRDEFGFWCWRLRRPGEDG